MAYLAYLLTLCKLDITKWCTSTFIYLYIYVCFLPYMVYCTIYYEIYCSKPHESSRIAPHCKSLSCVGVHVCCDGHACHIYCIWRGCFISTCTLSPFSTPGGGACTRLCCDWWTGGGCVAICIWFKEGIWKCRGVVAFQKACEGNERSAGCWLWPLTMCSRICVCSKTWEENKGLEFLRCEDTRWDLITAWMSIWILTCDLC